MASDGRNVLFSGARTWRQTVALIAAGANDLRGRGTGVAERAAMVWDNLHGTEARNFVDSDQ